LVEGVVQQRDAGALALAVGEAQFETTLADHAVRAAPVRGDGGPRRAQSRPRPDRPTAAHEPSGLVQGQVRRGRGAGEQAVAPPVLVDQVGAEPLPLLREGHRLVEATLVLLRLVPEAVGVDLRLLAGDPDDALLAVVRVLLAGLRHLAAFRDGTVLRCSEVGPLLVQEPDDLRVPALGVGRGAAGEAPEVAARETLVLRRFRSDADRELLGGGAGTGAAYGEREFARLVLLRHPDLERDPVLRRAVADRAEVAGLRLDLQALARRADRDVACGGTTGVAHLEPHRDPLALAGRLQRLATADREGRLPARGQALGVEELRRVSAGTIGDDHVGAVVLGSPEGGVGS